MSQRMTLLPAALLVLFALYALRPQVGRAEPEADAPNPGATIAWLYDVPAAFERAAAEEKVVMICINAKHASGLSGSSCNSSSANTRADGAPASALAQT